jgi:hydrogenase maturation protease
MTYTTHHNNLFPREPCDVLVAGVGNIFLGDDAFGVEVAQKMASRDLPEGVGVVDFGIRGLDLAFAILDGCGTVILVDAVARGEPPGTLYVLEPQIEADNAASQSGTMIDAHGMDPVSVLRLVRHLGGPSTPIWLVGCEPTPLPHDGDFPVGLSEPVAAAVDKAVELVEQIAKRLLDGRELIERIAAAETL